MEQSVLWPVEKCILYVSLYGTWSLCREFTVDGDIVIELTCHEETDEVVLNQNGLEVDETSFTLQGSDGKAIGLEKMEVMEEIKQRAILIQLLR